MQGSILGHVQLPSPLPGQAPLYLSLLLRKRLQVEQAANHRAVKAEMLHCGVKLSSVAAVVHGVLGFHRACDELCCCVKMGKSFLGHSCPKAQQGRSGTHVELGKNWD